MPKEEYRVRAAECLQLADDATDPLNKAILTEIAQAWLRLLDQAEKNRRTDIAYEAPPESPDPTS